MPAKTPKSPAKDRPEPPASDGGLLPGMPEPAAPAPAYQVLARRYRSRDFDELVGQEAIARTLRNAIRTGRTAHAYLFCGTRGVGKTSMARIFARALNADGKLQEADAVAGAILRGEDLDVIEIDAASNRGIDNARDLIANAGLLPTRGRHKIYIVDEVHMLTTPAFNALLKTMEEPPPHVKFILCTTEPQSVPATIQSRCQRFDFRAIPVASIAGHLRDVLARENASADERVTMAIARMANGSMRDALSLLDRLLAAAEPDAGGAVTLSWTLLEEIFGLPDETLFERALGAIGAGTPGEALAAGAAVLERGISVERALDLLAERFRWLLLAKVAGGGSDLLEVADETRAALARLAEPFDAAALVHHVALCDAVGQRVRDSSTPRALFDAALVRMCLPERFVSAGAGGGGEEPKKAPPRAAEPAVRPAVVGIEPKPASPPVAKPADPKPAMTPTGTPPGTPAVAEAGTGSPWERILALAARSPLTAALLAPARFLSFDGRTITLAVSLAEAGGRYLREHPDDVRTVAEKALGGRVEVRIEPIADEAAPASAATPRGPVPEPLRNHPRIRAVSEALDAKVVEVSPRPPDGGLFAVDPHATPPAASESAPEVPDDV